MNKPSRRKRIRRKDYLRVLITETLPFETPIIFSNDGLYERISGLGSATKIQQELVRTLIFGESDNLPHSTIPYVYKIRKTQAEFRRLALLHPNSQWKMKCFYQRYEDLLLYYCSRSPASIRAPQKIAGSFFFKNSFDNLNQYKTSSVSLLSLDELTKHSPSFFTYRGFDRLYKFFLSPDYFRLEKSFCVMRTLDVTKCFNSIYTHSMSWAIKDKEFTKKHVGTTATFAQQFDKLMQHANHGETSGIVIGPEVSRIFAEIILQEIDTRVIAALAKASKTKEGKIFGKQYSFRRYVDDVFIFATDSQMAKDVYDRYADCLLDFNLHTNVSKSTELARPFVTVKSRIIHEASLAVNDFIEKFLEAVEGAQALKPKRILSTWRLTQSFIENIKSLCSYNSVTYDEIAAFLISVFTERIKKIVAVEEVEASKQVAGEYCDAILVLLDVLFFLYKVSPSVGASYKLCTSAILLNRFVKSHVPLIKSTVAQRTFELTESLLEELKNSATKNVDGFLHLECLNVVLAARELGAHFYFPQETLKALFNHGEAQSYFSIVSCLYYVQDEPRYAELRKYMLGEAAAMLTDLSDIRMNSEKAYLFLDLVGCPYVPEKRRATWLRRAMKVLGLEDPSSIDVLVFLNAATNTHVHVDWADIDLLSSLEKKELKQAY